MYKYLGILVFALALPLGAVYADTSITQHGITWTFDRDYHVGQFVNGDYWVVGPVTIISVSPAWDGEKNGSMVDPVPLAKQGYDSRINMGFDPASRVIFPTTISGISSLISTRGLEEVKVGGAAEGLDTACVLTIVNFPVPGGTFRPPYVAGDKPFYNTSQVNYDIVPILPLPTGISVPNTTNMMEKVWLDHGPPVTGATIHPRANMPPYPRDSSMQVSMIALKMMLNTPERESLINRLVQLGIDLYPISLSNGKAFAYNGGFGSGRKWPLLFAGTLLGSEEIRHPPETISPTSPIRKFQEDANTYYGQPTVAYPDGKPLWGYDCNIEGYSEPYWTNHDCRDPDGILEDKEMVNGGGYSICCTSYTWVGQALAARLMGAKELWDWPPFFDYVDRWIDEGGSFGSDFVKGMWQAYREFSEGIVPAPTFDSIHGSLSSISIDWSHPIPDYIDGYSVYRATSPDGPFTQVKEGHTGLSYEDREVGAGTHYWYRLSALMDGKESVLTHPVECYLSNQWGKEDFESALWTNDSGVLFNDIRWNIRSGAANRTNLTELTSELNGYWLRPGLNHPEPALVVSHYPVDGDFVLSFDNYQKYGVADMGAVLLFSDTNNYYNVEIARDRFRIHRVMGGVSTQIGNSNALGMQHAPSSARFEIDVTSSTNTILFTCKKTNWIKYNTGEIDSNVYTFQVEDTDPAANETFVSGGVGFYQATVNDWNVAYYDNIVITQKGSIGSPPLTSTPTPPTSPSPTLMPTSSPTAPGGPPATMTPVPEAGVHAPNVVFNSGATAGIELVLIGQDQPVAHDAVGRKDNPTGILLNAFGESFLVDTMGSDSWLTTNSESQNVILVDDAVPGPIDAWMQEGPSRATHAFPTASLFTSGVPDVSVPIQYGSMSSQLGSPNDQSFYSDRIRVDRRVFSSEGRFFVLYDEVTAVDGQQHTFSWVGHTDGSLSFPSANAVNVVKESGNRVEVRFFGPPLEFSLYDLPEDSDGDGEEEARPYFTTQKIGVGTQFLTVLFPVRSGEQSPTYASLYTPVGEAGLVRFDGADYLFFAQGGDRQEVLLDDRLSTNARFLIAKSLGQDLLEVFAIEQSGPLRWDGNLIVNESMVRSYLYQRTEAGVALTTLD